MRTLIAALVLAGMATPCLAGGFHDPVQLTSGGKPVGVESPGYAAPWLHDVDGDGVRDLLVGQFRSGKINVWRGSKAGATEFGAHQWLQAAGKVAEVPGVW